MIAEAGHAALWLAAAFALLAAIGPRLRLDVATPAIIVSALFGLAALLSLGWSFAAADFSLVLVDERVHRLQPTMTRVAMLTGSTPGRVLLLATLLAAFAALAPRLAPAAAAAFVASLVLHPFLRQPFVPTEGRHLTVPVDPFAALAQPPIIALAAALLLAAVLLPGPFKRPPRRLGLVAVLALLSGGAAVAASRFGVETSAPLRPGETLSLQGVNARLVSLSPVAGPGYTAIEARIAVGDEILRPQARTLIHASTETPVPDSARRGVSRIEATLGPPRGAAREVRLRWSPL